MSDLTTQFFWHCSTAEYFQTKVVGSKGDTYTVRWDNSSHKDLRGVQYDWSCDCTGYKMRSGYCSHIKKVIAQRSRCGWMQFVNGGEPVDHKCPNCGSEISSMGWGV